MRSFITYEGLPVSAGGAHSLGNKDYSTVYDQTERFLLKFTDCNKTSQTHLTFYASQEGTYNTLPILFDLTRKFGIPKPDSWNFGTTRQKFFTWRITEGKKEKAFEILERYKSLPKNEYGPIILSFLWKFKLVDPETGLTLPGQNEIPVLDKRQHNSQLHLRLGKKSTISAWLAFPFDNLNDSSSKYIDSLSASLPFKPSDKHWRVWRQSKTDGWYSRTIEINAS